MGVLLNHTIVRCRDRAASASYLTETLGLEDAKPWGPFMVVEMDNQVSLDYLDVGGDAEIASQHYAFIVAEDTFDAAFARIESRQEYWADPGLNRPHEINHRDGGRGVYFKDPDGHVLEIITRPYGSGG
jgi:catechol 2,3-dioxygenase-like lactoylglutathione lyase family enzyme